MKTGINHTDRQFIRMVAEGLSSDEMAIRMKYKKDSVDAYLMRLMKFLDVKNRPELVSYAYLNNILQPPPRKVPMSNSLLKYSNGKPIKELNWKDIEVIKVLKERAVKHHNYNIAVILRTAEKDLTELLNNKKSEEELENISQDWQYL